MLEEGGVGHGGESEGATQDEGAEMRSDSNDLWQVSLRQHLMFHYTVGIQSPKSRILNLNSYLI